MKPTFTFHILLLISLCILQSCGDKGFAEPRVKKYVNHQRAEWTEYSYYPDGKIKTMQFSNGKTKHYTYSDNQVIILSKDSLGTESFYDTMKLDKNGRFVQTTEEYDMSGITVKNKYDDEGYRVFAEFSSGDTLLWTEEEKIKDGNIVYQSHIPADSANGRGIKTYVEFYTDKLNTVSSRHTGQEFMSRLINDSKNLKKTTVGISPSGDTISVTTYRYEFDDQNRVTKKVSYYPAGVVWDSMSFSYY